MESKTQEEASIIKVSSLHCIDLANSDLRQLAVSLKQACPICACLDCGFFYVINHGISEELKDEVFKQSKKIFALPLEEKMKLLRNEKYRGYAPLHDQLLDPDNQVRGDYKEGFSIGVLCPKDDSRDNPFYSPNIWPDPDVLPGWRATMETFYQEALRVCKAIASIMELALDLDVNYFDKPNILGNHNAVMRLLHYEGNSDPSKGIYASGAHSDYGMMTNLATDSVMGLQIHIASGYWEWSRTIFHTIFLGTKSRMYSGVSSYLPVRKQPSQISRDQMFNVPHATLQGSTCGFEHLRKVDPSDLIVHACPRQIL
ncbi:unnamed protein product [Brassica napus]|uniref:(rape) hypothetical protein n=1 Tax=Brassica napus TaxID=3708 RepID=A0A816JGA7_BRANA|nr:unnamed protein product [Brassica napus]